MTLNFQNPREFERYLGTILAALHHWNHAQTRGSMVEGTLASGNGRFPPLSHDESNLLFSYLSTAGSQLPAGSIPHPLPRTPFTAPPWEVSLRGQRALLLGRDDGGLWEVANVNMSMGTQSDANLCMLQHAPVALNALLRLLEARNMRHPLPWEDAESAALASTARP